MSAPGDVAEAILTLMVSPDLSSKAWIWKQYDRHVMADTAASSEDPSDAAVVRVHKTNKALAITTDCTPRYCEAGPIDGGRQAVAEAWRNLTATGADPIAITDCLNFGNPERPEIMGQFAECVEGMIEACKALDFPVVSGNVSLYNETNGKAIPPTPAVGAVGLIPDLSKRAHFGGLTDGDVLMLVGETKGWLGASLYLREIEGREEGAPPPVDLAAEKRHGDFVRTHIRAGHLSAVHDLSDGGLAAASAEMAMASGTGIQLALQGDVPLHGLLFGEDQARYLIAATPSQAESVRAAAEEAGVPLTVIGLAGGDALTINGEASVSIEDLKRVNAAFLPALMGG